MKFFKIDSNFRLSKEDIISLLTSSATWNGKRFYDLAFNIYNTNMIGNIDQNDLITYLKSVYCSTNYEQFMTEDILLMAEYMDNKKQSNNFKIPDGVNT